ncbi:MAG: acetate--CoA ligase family protein [Candidatus Thermoplasmatota archaeon]|nr:acetate--CoA ligase family protein [Candidatus Thermoplasmatota archaeon]
MNSAEDFIQEIKSNGKSEFSIKTALKNMGISVPRSLIIEDIPEKLDISYPVVLKVSDESILHKSDVGGVSTGIKTLEELKTRFNKMKKLFPDSQFLVEEMVEEGIEIIVGISRDNVFGLSLMLGMGGTMTEIYHDVTFRLIPVSRNDYNRMIDEVSIGKFTENGFRGHKIDRKALIDFLMKISSIGEAGENSIDQLDLNPVKMNGSKIVVLDAKIIAGL